MRVFSILTIGLVQNDRVRLKFSPNGDEHLRTDPENLFFIGGLEGGGSSDSNTYVNASNDNTQCSYAESPLSTADLPSPLVLLHQRNNIWFSSRSGETTTVGVLTASFIFCLGTRCQRSQSLLLWLLYGEPSGIQFRSEFRTRRKDGFQREILISCDDGECDIFKA